MLPKDVPELALRPNAQSFKADLKEQTLDSQQCAALGLPPGTMWFDPNSKAQNNLIREQLKNSEFKDIRDMVNAENVVMRPPLPASTVKAASVQPVLTVPDQDEAVHWARMHGFAEEETKVLRSIFKLTSTIKPEGWLTGIEFGKEIGKGAFGSIHKAVYNGQNVAVKRVTQDTNLLNGGTMQHTGNLQQTIRNIYLELNVLVCLDHPNIVAFKGMIGHFPTLESSDTGAMELGMVFEFCEEGNLHSLLFKQHRALSYADRFAVARGVAAAMAHVHSLSIIHRDLSSPNVLFAKGLQVRVADFGLSRKFLGGSYDSTTIAGSPQYMPPEQLAGGLLTPAVDVWALGVLLWELLTGRPAWAEEARGRLSNYDVFRRLVADGGARLPAPGDDAAGGGMATAAPDGDEGARRAGRLLAGMMATDPAARPTMLQVQAACEAELALAGDDGRRGGAASAETEELADGTGVPGAFDGEADGGGKRRRCGGTCAVC